MIRGLIKTRAYRKNPIRNIHPLYLKIVNNETTMNNNKDPKVQTKYKTIRDSINAENIF